QSFVQQSFGNLSINSALLFQPVEPRSNFIWIWIFLLLRYTAAVVGNIPLHFAKKFIKFLIRHIPNVVGVGLRSEVFALCYPGIVSCATFIRTF
ncbi:MAG: hypothetical protein IJV16_07285, partial [Lachnospiraceae bacterium]|nr:hypothetical protein [Lachnospiraceae bacterium]